MDEDKKILKAAHRDAAVARLAARNSDKLTKQLTHITEAVDLMGRAMGDMEDIDNDESIGKAKKLELKLKMMDRLMKLDVSKYQISSKEAIPMPELFSLVQELFMMSERVFSGNHAMHDAWCLQATDIVNKYVES